MSLAVSGKKAGGRERWSQLPKELLGQILLQLTELSDFSRFGQVCTSWHSAVTTVRCSTRPPPLLVLECSHSYSKQGDIFAYKQIRENPQMNLSDSKREEEKCYGLFTLSSDGMKFHLLSNMVGSLQSLKESIAGSSRGWLVLLQKNGFLRKFSLLNPVSGERIDLPSWRITPEDEYFSPTNFNKHINFRKFNLSSSPTSNDCVIMALCTLWGLGNALLASCRPQRDNEWKIVYYDLQYRIFDRSMDMTFYNGRVYVINKEGATMIFDIDPQSEQNVIIGEPRLIASSADDNVDSPFFRYLIESDGELLQVAKRHGPKFEIFKLEADSWVKVQCLGDQVLLLDNHKGQSVSSKDFLASGFRGNCIYYFTYRHGPDCVYIYSIEDGSTQSIHLPEGSSLSYGSYWFKPQIW